MRTGRTLFILAALSGACAVILGAFASHGAPPAAKALLTTGAHYQLAHALLALGCGRFGRDRLVRGAGWIALTGGAIFSAALALIAMAGWRFMGAVAPIGGLAMITAWLLLSIAAFRTWPSGAE